MRQFDYEDMVFNINSDGTSVTLANVKLPGIFSTSTLYYNTHPMQNMNGTSVFVVPETAKDKLSGKEYVVTTIAKSAFDCVRSVTEVHIPKTITKIKWSFWDCYKLQRFVVSPNNKKYCAIDGVLYSKDKKVLIAYPNAKGSRYKIPNGVEEIANCAFKNTSIEHITASATLQRIGQNAFYGCCQLEWIINIPKSIVEVVDYQDPKRTHSANPNCRMDNGQIVTYQELISQY